MLGPQPSPGAVTVDELIRSRPSSNIEGLVDRRYLAPGEVVLFETRPSFVGFALPGLVGSLVIAVVGPVLIALAQSTGGFAGVDPNLVLLLIALVVIAAVAGGIGAVVEWWYRCYAVTTTRILDKRGAWTRTIIDVPHGAVQSVMFLETGPGRAFNFGTLQFSSASVAGFALGGSGGSRPGVVNWRAVPQPIESRAFYESVRKAKFE